MGFISSSYFIEVGEVLDAASKGLGFDERILGEIVNLETLLHIHSMVSPAVGETETRQGGEKIKKNRCPADHVLETLVLKIGLADIYKRHAKLVKGTNNSCSIFC